MSKLEQKKPILYSFRRCPFAMRARLIIKKCNINDLYKKYEPRIKIQKRKLKRVNYECSECK